MIDLLSGISSTSAALTAERTRLDVIGENIANANVSKGPNGLPYQRKVVVFETALQQAVDGTSTVGLSGATIKEDPSPFQRIHMPGSPDADENGMVLMPNVNLHKEMADMIAASRAFEANLSVVRNARSMAMQTLSIGKR